MEKNHNLREEHDYSEDHPTGKKGTIFETNTAPIGDSALNERNIIRFLCYES